MKRLLAMSIALTFITALIAACASKPPQKIEFRPVNRSVPEPTHFKASFNCEQSASSLQDIVCADNTLSTLDHDMADAYRLNLRLLDLVGRMQLIANQRHWLLGRTQHCRLSPTRLGAGKPNPRQVACLNGYYRNRIAELKAWPQPQARDVASSIGADKFHPLTAYVEFRLVDGRGSTLCASFAKQFNDAIAKRGEVNFARMAGFEEIAGTHGAANASGDGHSYSVGLYDAGPYASYQLRAVGLDIDGQAAIHDRSIGEWVANLPNAGGRFGNTSSQTRDYASIDVFRTQQHTYALVTEAWGFYSAAALGESDYAGVYEVSAGGVQPLCLYSTYLTPPIARAFDALPAYKELNQTLLQMTGEPPALEQDERRDEGLLRHETEWNLLNMPLVAIGEIERFGRLAALRQRHDVALDTIWSWSERNLPCKLLYRRLLPMIQPAYEELIASFQQREGLKLEEAKIAADLMIMDLIDQAAETLSDFTSAMAAPLPPFAQYAPRYAPAPMPGDLERGRKLATLHSAALNRAPADTIADFIKYDFGSPDRPHGIGSAGDTALMAAVRSPDTVSQLLAAGFDVNATNDWKKTALMTAAQTNQLASAQVLLEAGADVRRATVCWHANNAGALDNEEGAVSGRTALMYAAAGAGESMIQLLIDRGADPSKRDAAGRSACDYLGSNNALTDAERPSVKKSLCTPDSYSPSVNKASLAQPCPINAIPSFTEEEAKQLGGPVLTLWGAERAGSDDGLIPEYTGSGVKAPPGWNPENPGVRPDPYEEKPLFTITANNADQYADKLGATIEVFRKFPDFRMDIYPSHRDFAFPKFVLDNTVRNAASCMAKDNGLKLEGCYGGVPFPIPETGNQVMWNHLTAYTSRASAGRSASYIVPPTGFPILVSVTRNIQDFPFYDPDNTNPRSSSSIFWRALFILEQPARWVGTQLMLLNPLEQLGIGSRTYFYNNGRAKLMPSLAYDTPVPWSGDTQTMDDIKVFNGALDRYNFKLLGKKEKFIYSNGFKLTDPKVCPANVVLTKHFPNPDCVRWELHRVWVVEATLKPGFSHAYSKRIFYWDEDNYIAGQAENYDADGKLYRIVVGITYPYFEAPGGENAATFSLDMKTGAWSGQGIACNNCGDWPLSASVDDKVFSPEAMAAVGIR